MKRALLGLFVFLIVIYDVFGQARNVTGVVTSADDGQALPGVTVLVKGTTIGTTTDIDGKFKLSELIPETILVFSFIGFETMEVLIADKLIVNVQLAVTTKQLEEVVVTALGITRQEREIGYSTEKIDVDVVTRSNTSNVISSITGRAAGVQVSNNKWLIPDEMKLD